MRQTDPKNVARGQSRSCQISTTGSVIARTIKIAAIAISMMFIVPLSAQNVRWDFDVYTVQAQGGNLLPVYAIPGAGIVFYNEPAGTLATTYISATSATTCPTAPTPAQVVLNGTSTCVSSADPYGNMGGWFQPGQYMATITAQGASNNYYFTVGVSNGAYTQTGTSPNTLTGPLNGTSASFSGTVAAGTSVTGAGMTLNSQQANLVSPVIYDHFLYADGTTLSSQIAESGNSQWSVQAGPATVESQHLFASGGVGTGNYYATLANTNTVGGTPQPITTIGGTFKMCPNNDGAAPYPTTDATMIADHDVTLTHGLLHLEIGPQGWILVASLTSPSNFYTEASGIETLSVDCSTEYSAQMIINVAAGTVQVIPPNGVPSAVITDPNITTIDPLYGTWQGADDVTAGAPIAEWGSAWMGGPSQATKYSAGQAAAADVADLYGNNGTRRFVYPDVTIPNAAGGGGTGWYRIATQAAYTLFEVFGDFTISATNSVSNQIVKFTASGFSFSTTPIVTQTSNFGSFPSIIDQIRISTDGSANAAVDVHISGSASTYANTLSILGVGILTPATSFPVGATAYTNVATLTPSPQAAPFSQSFTGGAGWHVILTQGTPSGYGIVANVTEQFNDGVHQQILNFTAYSYNGGCFVQQTGQLAFVAANIFTQLRCSWNGATQMQVEGYQLNATAPVTGTGSIFGWATFPVISAAGSTALAGGSVTRTISANSGTTAQMYPLMLPIGNGDGGYPTNLAASNPCTATNDGETIFLTYGAAYYGPVSGNGSLHVPAVCENGTWQYNGIASTPAAAPVRAGAWSISSATSIAVTFSPAMAATPTSCSVTPSASAATTGTPFATALATTGFTVNVPTSGTLSGTYLCAVNNSN